MSNVAQLALAWTFTLSDLPADVQPSNSHCNPIIVDGMMYTTSTKRMADAIDAAIEKQIWSHAPYDGGGWVGGGVTFWGNGGDKRIFYAGGTYLVAVDARIGKTIESYGEKGM